MASNLNKAFMRAYAKDRPAHDSAASPQAGPASPPPMAVAAPVSPQVASQPTATPALDRLSRVQPMNNQLGNQRPMPTQAPAPIAPAAMPTVTQSARPIQSRPMQSQPVQVTRQPQVPPMQSAPIQTAPIHGAPIHSAPIHTAPVPSPKVQSPKLQSPPLQTNRPVVQGNAAAQASDVWRRLDSAHGASTKHPVNGQPRESVMVDANTTTRRMQAAAAAPAPVAPARPQPAFQPEFQPAPIKSPLPISHDDSAVVDEKSADTRRRTVADFLYAAGQYNPGRVLASAETPRSHSEPMPAARYGSVPAGLREDEMLAHAPQAQPAPMPASSHSVYDMALDQAMQTQPPNYPSQAMPAHPMPVTQEPLPRRMGQILRVDVPRTGSVPAAMPAEAPVEARVEKAMPVASVMTPAPVAPAPPVASMPVPTSTQPVPSSPTIDAPTAKYVIEQRRLDRAHKLSAAEEKLRSQAHKIFNPVWEVDNLQWPAVVDKLMQQRADSMAHVAAHLKSACQDGLSVLGVTSAGQSEGRTTVACCLARLAAMHGINVVLVDVDLDRPTLCIQTNMEIEQDWRDGLSTETALEEVAVHSLEDQLTILPLKPRGSRPGLLASDGRIAQMLSELSESFELVIVDCSRTNSAGNVITGLAHTKIFDAAIVVVDRRDTNASRVEDAVRMIQQTGIESIGIVDNFSA